MHQFHYKQAFRLESGQSLPELTIAYHTYGKLNEKKDNVVWVCHALTANSDVMDWWKGLVTSESPINLETHFIVCANILGSCYGSTGPLSACVDTGNPFYSDFPLITMKDMVNAHVLLKRALGIEKISLLVGGSMGGYQVLEWALLEPDVIERLFLLVTSAAENAWGKAIHTAQRMAIEADATFGTHCKQAGAQGLKAARAIGMITYRNAALMNKQQRDTDVDLLDNYKVSSYLEYQGEKLVQRFNAYSYWHLTKAMDTHHIARGRGGNVEAVLKQIQQPVFLIGIASDLLCPIEEQKFIAAHLPDCTFVEIDSEYGHDGFLVETTKINAVLAEWM